MTKETLKILGMKDLNLFREEVYIAGNWSGAITGEMDDVFNPSTGKLLGRVPRCGQHETRIAIEAANKAMPAWKAAPAKERAKILRRWSELLVMHKKDLAILMTAEQGKPLVESEGEILYAASFIEWFAEEAKRTYGETIPTNMADRRLLVIKEGIGVTAAITPWNFPAAMITRKAGPALAAGCPMIIKPAPDTPFTALSLCELGERAGIPKGILSVVTGDAIEIGYELTSNAIVRKMSFTGSTPVGKLLMKQCSNTVKKLSLELGGNAPFIVFDDADVDKAVQGALDCKFRNAGQTCVSANRIMAQESVYDEFTQKLAEGASKIKVGDGFLKGCQQGPLINPAALTKVESHIQDAVEKGASVLSGGERHILGGNFLQPTVLGNMKENMLVAREETFGPLAPVFRFSCEEEALRMANDTEYGLAAYFFSKDLGRIWRVSENLEFGIVSINTGIFSSEAAPFGGMKESGIGREGSKYGIEEYLEVKYLCMGGI